MEAEGFRKLHQTEYFRHFIENKCRPDGRSFNDFRETVVAIDTISSANASAMVKLGDTTLVVGIKCEVMQPPEETPTHGKIAVNVELPALCGPNFKLGKPSEASVALGSFLTDLLIDSSVIDLTTLCIEPAKAVWTIYVDIYCLNFDGNMTDACLIGINACLPLVTLPNVVLTPEGNLKTDTSTTKKINMKHFLLPSTFAIFDGNIICDPTDEEETLMEFGVVVVCDENDVLYCVHKMAQKPCNFTTISECIKLANIRNKAIKSYLTKLHRS
eukprot:c36929_g2_i1.p1 GENE.c36929_g2_i1~~c36929_g2_i1.p1  ORF type:complete len:272 (-),score=75.00 c36929_g2_i1:18-833(-)